MADEADPVGLDVQGLPDTAVTAYEAIATLEFCGQRTSLDNIASATSLARPSLERDLADMTRRRLILRRDEQAADGPVYIPAQRSWSAAPDQGEGPQMSRLGQAASPAAAQVLVRHLQGWSIVW